MDPIDVKRIPLNHNLVDDPITVESAAHSLIIFDDTDSIEDELVKDAVYKFLNTVLQIGRSYKINAIITNHLATGGKFTKVILNESHSTAWPTSRRCPDSTARWSHPDCA